MNKQNLKFYIDESRKWLDTLSSMRCEKEFTTINSWIVKEIAETNMLLQLLNTIKNNKER